MSKLIAWSKGWGEYGFGHGLLFDDGDLRVGIALSWHTYPQFFPVDTLPASHLSDKVELIHNRMADDIKVTRPELVEKWEAMQKARPKPAPESSQDPGLKPKRGTGCAVVFLVAALFLI